MKHIFLVNDKESGAECLVGPCTVQEFHEMLRLWGEGEVNDNSPFDDRWGFQPVDLLTEVTEKILEEAGMTLAVVGPGT